MMNQGDKKITLHPVLFFYSAFIGIALAISYFSQHHPFFKTELKKIEWWHPAIGLGVAFLVVGISFCLTRYLGFAQKLEEEFKKHLTPLDLHSIFGMAAASALGEEFLFRGVLQPQLGLFGTSIIFGLFHFPFKKELLAWSIMALVMGFVLGGLYEYTGNLLASILCHFGINFLNILIMNKRTSSQ
ncbi:MAG: CPBP family intramembrane metalloprotease [Deltaproteobacteria bacterium]|nr:CPBP family intramembrane metalloprotease [Deltaproteobacteria bacterium]